MQSYTQLSSESHHQPLDFTSKRKTNEPPILDLSCKKQQQDNNQESYDLSPVSMGTHSLSSSREATSPSSDHPHQSQQISCGHERKSPIEVRTFMVTPPSESDSPKKTKFNLMYPKLISSNAEMPPRYPRMNMSMPLLMSPVLSNVLTGENMSRLTEPAPLPTTTTTTTTTIINSIPPSEHSVSVSQVSPEPSKKGPRPFKAYPKDPLSMSIGPAELIHDQISNDAYNEFRKRMLESVRKTNEGTNIKMRRVCKSPPLPTSTMDDKDAAYWERRRKNNEAAKRSRDARRAKEDEIAIRAAFLEQENMQLKCELVALRNETAKLRCMIFTN